MKTQAVDVPSVEELMDDIIFPVELLISISGVVKVWLLKQRAEKVVMEFAKMDPAMFRNIPKLDPIPDPAWIHHAAAIMRFNRGDPTSGPARITKQAAVKAAARRIKRGSNDAR